MEKVSDALIASTFQKVKDVDIFSLKAYMERTDSLSASTGMQVALTDIFVNLPFFILNLIVGFFSIILRFFENFSLYESYRQTVFNASKKLWDNLSGSGNYNNSLLYLLIALSVLSIFLSFLFSKGDFSRRLIHLFVVILLGMGYFGTIQSTSGGVYLLDTVHQMANSFSDAVTQLSVASPDDTKKVVSKKSSIADDYIMKTSYTAYLYVNTGQLNGSFHNNQTGKDEKLDNSQILGKYDKDGKFIQPKSKAILDYTDKCGDGANDGTEKNRWFSAVNDYLWLKSLYVIFKIVEAIIIAIPLLLIQLIAFLADILVIVLMFIFPLALLVSFLPKMQDVVFNVLKVMFGAVSFPALAGFLTLIVFYIQALIATFIKDKFTDGKLLSSSNLRGQSILFMLVITVVVQGIVFWGIWKYKEQFLKLILGSKTAQVVSQSADKVAEKANELGVTPKAMYEKTHDMSSLAMIGAGYGVGKFMNAQDNWNAFKEKQFESSRAEGGEEAEIKIPYDHSVEEGDLTFSKDEVYDSEYPDSISFEKGIIDNPENNNQYDESYMKDTYGDYQPELDEFDSEKQVFVEEPFIETPSKSFEGSDPVDISFNSNSDQAQHEDLQVSDSSINQMQVVKEMIDKGKIENRVEYHPTIKENKKMKSFNAFQRGFNASRVEDNRLNHKIEQKSKILEELEKLRGGR
ncbi:TPA: hypothetical protein ACJRZ2_001437 [Streptococcus agalactiae]|nr:hypothetical protein [Streptococcus agalactiae]